MKQLKEGERGNVRIISCPGLRIWYRDHIGDEFSVAYYDDRHVKVEDGGQLICHEDYEIIDKEEQGEATVEKLWIVQFCTDKLDTWLPKRAFTTSAEAYDFLNECRSISLWKKDRFRTVIRTTETIILDD